MSSINPTTVEEIGPGSVLAHYTIVEKIADGGMGSVYKAYESGLDRHVALKVLHPQFAAKTNYVRHFQAEAQLIASLQHPNIVPIYYTAKIGSIVFFSMAFIDGPTLEEAILGNHRYSIEETKWFLNNASAALEYAAKAGVIHLDIKPSNFLVDSTPTLLLTDFGLARHVEENSQTEGADIYGTPFYISPEQIQGHPTDPRTDIYGLGVTLYHLVTGNPPFDSPDLNEVLVAHLQSPFPAEKALAAGVPSYLVSLMHRMMEKDPTRRFQSYAELRYAVENLEYFQYEPSLPVRLGAYDPFMPLKELPSLITVGTLIGNEMKVDWMRSGEEGHWMRWAKETVKKSTAFGDTLGIGKLERLCIQTDYGQAVVLKVGDSRIVAVQDAGENMESLEVACQQVASQKS